MAEREPVRVLIVDDHEMVAAGFRALLDEEPDLAVVGVARTAHEGLDLAARETPDVVLMDYRLPDEAGTAAALRLRSEHPEIAIVFVTAADDPAVVASALAAGGAGFISKGRGLDDLVATIRAVAHGAAVFPTDLLATALADRDLRGPGADLTERERDVLGLLAHGLSTEQMARRLFVSPHTVRNHVRNVLAKLGARSKLEAVVIAAREGLVTFDKRDGASGPASRGGSVPGERVEETP